MKKRWKIFVIILLSLVVLFLIIGGVFVYLIFNESGRDKNGGGSGSVPLINPVQGLSDEEAVAKFNEGFVLYILQSIKAYNLHNPPFSSDTPKIEFVMENEIYNTEVINKNIKVRKGSMSNEDIRITTTKQEGVKMLRNRSYIEASFNNGNSGFEMVAGKVKLFSKGYLDLYEELTGKSAN